MLSVRMFNPWELPAMIACAVETAMAQLVPRDRPFGTREAVSAQILRMYDAALSQPGGTILVAEEAGEQAEPGTSVLHGWVLLMPQPNPFTGAPELVVMDIFTAPALRGRGIAKRLLAEAERHARELGCGSLAAQVALHNRSSLRLFQGAGYDSERLVVGKSLEPAQDLAGGQAD